VRLRLAGRTKASASSDSLSSTCVFPCPLARPAEGANQHIAYLRVYSLAVSSKRALSVLYTCAEEAARNKAQGRGAERLAVFLDSMPHLVTLRGKVWMRANPDPQGVGEQDGEGGSACQRRNRHMLRPTTTCQASHSWCKALPRHAVPSSCSLTLPRQAAPSCCPVMQPRHTDPSGSPCGHCPCSAAPSHSPCGPCGRCLVQSLGDGIGVGVRFSGFQKHGPMTWSSSPPIPLQQRAQRGASMRAHVHAQMGTCRCARACASACVHTHGLRPRNWACTARN